ncbi:SyrB family protein [Brucella suis]|nr:SyrB family protein [Brucella suis]
MATEFEHGPDMYTPEDVIKILKIILHSPVARDENFGK